MKRVLIFILLLALLALPLTASAENTYKTYFYDVWGDPIASPDGYDVERTLSGKTLGIGDFSMPQDLFVYQGRVYLLDSGNQRIIVLDQNYQVVDQIREFHRGEETVMMHNEASGLFIKDDLIYLADTKNERILVSDLHGNIQKEYTRPKTDLISDTAGFKPKKVLLDSSDIIYVLCEGVNVGAVMLDSDNTFLGFYGANRISTTMELLSEMFWRAISTKEQQAQMKKYHPVEYNSFAIDENDFIYTVTLFNEGTSEIKKLNPMGNNIFDEELTFGDLKSGPEIGYTEFVDICVSDKGYITAVARNSGKIFQYDRDGYTLMIFGGVGDQSGTYGIVSAIEVFNEDLLVLDSSKNTVTVLRPTHYTELLHNALDLYEKGLYEESVQPWQEVLRLNSNMQFAYSAIAKSQVLLGDYKGAMENYRIAYDMEGYSEAKTYRRQELLRENFAAVAIGFNLLCVALYVWVKIREKKKRGRQT